MEYGGNNASQQLNSLQSKPRESQTQGVSDERTDDGTAGELCLRRLCGQSGGMEIFLKVGCLWHQGE